MAACGSKPDDVDWEKTPKPSEAGMSPDVISMSATGKPKRLMLPKSAQHYDEVKNSEMGSLIKISMDDEEEDDLPFRVLPGSSVIKMSSVPFLAAAISDESLLNLEPEANLLVTMDLDEVFQIIKKTATPPMRSPPALLYGAPGTGKTSVVQRAVAELGNSVRVYYVSANELRGAKEKDSLQLLQDIFEKASNNSPSVVFLDDVELLHSSASKLLTINRKGIQIIASTNRPHHMDVSMLEAFVDKYHLSLPSIQTINDAFKTELSDLAKHLSKNEYENAMKSLKAASFSMRDVKTLLEETLASDKVVPEVFNEILKNIQSNQDEEYFLLLRNWSARCAN